MPETTYGSVVGDARGSVSSAADSLSDMTSEAIDKASDLASQAQEKASELGQKAVKRLGATADYFREHEMKEMVSDLNSYVKSHPTQALLGAAALGFLTAVLLRRR